MKILVAGFDPFGSEKTNPSWEAIKKIPNQIDDKSIIKVQIPTLFYQSIDVLLDSIKRERPHSILCVGQSGGRTDLTIERIGINIDDARIPDNNNYQPIDHVIYPDGDNAYFVKLPIKIMMKRVQESGIPCSISNTAGTYVCNHILYALLYHIEKHNIALSGGFVHVPYVPSQVVNKPHQPSMSLETIAQGLIEIIKVIDTEKDLLLSGGLEN